MAHLHAFEPEVLNVVEARNAAQKRILFRKLAQRLRGGLRDCSGAVWGLALKPDTDELREASSATLIEELVGTGAKVRADAPSAVDEAKRVFPKAWLEQADLTLAHDQYDARRGADAVTLVTEWNPFRSPDLHLMRKIMVRPLIMDGRNVYAPELVQELGFEYSGIGRNTVFRHDRRPWIRSDQPRFGNQEQLSSKPRVRRLANAGHDHGLGAFDARTGCGDGR